MFDRILQEIAEEAAKERQIAVDLDGFSGLRHVGDARLETRRLLRRESQQVDRNGTSEGRTVKVEATCKQNLLDQLIDFLQVADYLGLHLRTRLSEPKFD